jgi:hypothetical protein
MQPREDRGMAWKLEGTYFESCSCDTVCPCTASMSIGADLDYCRVVLAFNVKDGDVEGLDVSGIGAALIVDAPKVMTDGGWKVGLYLSDAATDEQAEALGRVFGGQLGGPPAAIAPLLGEFLGVERAPMEFSEDGLTHAVKIGDAVDIEVEDLVSFGAEGNEPAKLTDIVHPAGTTLTVSTAKRAKVDGFGISYEGHTGFSSPHFVWAG